MLFPEFLLPPERGGGGKYPNNAQQHRIRYTQFRGPYTKRLNGFRELTSIKNITKERGGESLGLSLPLSLSGRSLPSHRTAACGCSICVPHCGTQIECLAAICHHARNNRGVCLCVSYVLFWVFCVHVCISPGRWKEIADNTMDMRRAARRQRLCMHGK